MINSGIDINHVNHDGETALIYCIKKGYPKPFQYLPSNPNIDINVVDNSGRTAAMYLVERGRRDEFLSLLKKNCNLEYVDVNNNALVLSILLNKMYNYEFDHRYPVTYDTYIRMFVALVSLSNYQIYFNISVDDDENTAFMIILSMNDLDTIAFCAKRMGCLDLSIKNKYGENATSPCVKLRNRKVFNFIKDNITFNYYYRDPVNQNTLLMLSVMNNCVFMGNLLI